MLWQRQSSSRMRRGSTYAHCMNSLTSSRRTRKRLLCGRSSTTSPARPSAQPARKRKAGSSTSISTPNRKIKKKRNHTKSTSQLRQSREPKNTRPSSCLKTSTTSEASCPCEKKTTNRHSTQAGSQSNRRKLAKMHRRIMFTLSLKRIRGSIRSARKSRSWVLGTRREEKQGKEKLREAGPKIRCSSRKRMSSTSS